MEKWDIVIALFSITMFLVYLSTLSISLDDEDSAHFALGIGEFNVTKYQPHPPGFPVYMAIGMFFNLLIGDEILTLTFISALFGALSVFIFYLLAREMFNKEIALLSSVLMSITPLFWLNSVKAMSDMVGLFFVLFSVLFIYRFMKHKKPRDFYIGTLISGISLGIRIHYIFLLVPLIIFSSLSQKNHTKLKGALLFMIAILAWLLPLILITGIPEYLSVAGNQLAYRVDKPYISAIGSGITYGDLSNRLSGFLYYFLLGGYGINIADLGILSVLLLLFMVILGILFMKGINPRDRRFIFFSLGIVPYLIAVFIILPPFNPRYLLILIPLFSLAFTHTVWNLKRPNTRYLLLGVLIFLVLVHSIFLALVIRNTPSPPVQLIGYVNENYRPGDAVILDGFALKYFIYYQTNLTLIPSGTADCETIHGLLSKDRKVLTVSGNTVCEDIDSGIVTRFERDSRVHIKRSMISLYEFILE